MSNLKKQILENIKREGITPTSRFYFVSRNYFFWLLFVVCVIVGAISFSSILFQWVILGELTGNIHYSTPSLFIEFIPLFWIGLVVMFTTSAWYNVKQTNAPYKKENAVVVLSSILFSLLLGLLLFRAGVAHNLDALMKTHVEPYRSFSERHLEKAASVMEEKNRDPRFILLQREKLRTMCFNEGHSNCGSRIDELSEKEVTQEFEDFEKVKETSE